MTTSYQSRLGSAPEEGIKASCVAATTANITLSGEQTIDGVSVVAGDATDWNHDNDVVSGMLVNVAGGDTTDSLWEITFSGDHSIDSTVYTISRYGIGEDNTASNVGTEGVGVYRQKLLSDLQFRNIAPGSDKVTVALSGQNIEIDVVPSEINPDVPDPFTTSGIQFPTTGDVPEYSEGLLTYDHEHGSYIGYNGEEDVHLHIGEEQWVRARNQSGATILKGKVVYQSGASGNKPLIGLANADAIATAKPLGVAAHDIENNSEGILTRAGVLRDFDTDVFTAGDPVYLSAATAGEFTATKPTGATEYKVLVGFILNDHATQGMLLVKTMCPLQAEDIVGLSGPGLVQRVDATPLVTDETTSTVIPFDDSKPEITEGAQFNSVTITPTDAANTLVIRASFDLAEIDTNNYGAIALFKVGTTEALAASSQYMQAVQPVSFAIETHVTAGVADEEVTFTVRGGPRAGTLYINGYPTRKLGGAAAVRISVEEIKV